MMHLVIDASVAVKWLIAEDDSNIARTMAAKGEDLHAPRLMASEIANAPWRKARLRQRRGVKSYLRHDNRPAIRRKAVFSGPVSILPIFDFQTRTQQKWSHQALATKPHHLRA